MYENYKFYGPYTAKKGGRQIIVGVDSNNKKHTISYPRYLMEMHLGRYLEENEQVDHIDGNFLNNNIDNLQILLKGEHQKLDVMRNKDVTTNCSYCGKSFTIKGNKMHNRNKRGGGYFCSKQCSGKYGKMIQLKKVVKSKISKLNTSKYKVKSAQGENSEVEAG